MSKKEKLIIFGNKSLNQLLREKQLRSQNQNLVRRIETLYTSQLEGAEYKFEVDIYRF